MDEEGLIIASPATIMSFFESFTASVSRGGENSPTGCAPKPPARGDVLSEPKAAFSLRGGETENQPGAGHGRGADGGSRDRPDCDNHCDNPGHLRALRERLGHSTGS